MTTKSTSERAEEYAARERKSEGRPAWQRDDYKTSYIAGDTAAREEWKSEQKDLGVQVSQLKHAIRSIHQGLDKDCRHINSTYNGEASWCHDCKSIWLVEDIANRLKEENK